MIYNDEKTPLYTIIKFDNARKNGNYSFQIKWNVDYISGSKNAQGFIVQQVTVKDTTGLIKNYEGPYYEAWHVENGQTDSGSYDDKFEMGADGFTDDYVAEGSKGLKGSIKYIADLYWIDAHDSMFYIVRKWRPNTVSMAQDLPAILQKDCPEFNALLIDTRVFSVDVDNQD